MRRLAAVAAVAATLALLVAAACVPPPPAPPPAPPKDTPEQMIAAASEVKRSFVQAFNARDAEGIAALYAKSPDVVLLPPDAMKVEGHEAIRSTFAGMLAAMPPGTLELTDIHDVVLADAVASWGLWKLSMTMPDGTTLVQEGRFSDLIAKRDGKWVYLMDHASMPSPMAEEPAAPGGPSGPSGAGAPAAASAPAGG